MARKNDKFKEKMLWDLANSLGEKEWAKIHKTYNEKMNNNWTKQQLRKKMANLRREVKNGKILKDDDDDNQNNPIDQGKNQISIHYLSFFSLFFILEDDGLIYNM